MLKLILALLAAHCICLISLSQNAGIGTLTPHPSAVLELSATNKGILIPRVALTGIGNASPINAPAYGLLVYNTADAGAGVDLVNPGFYFWNSSTWVKLLSGNESLWYSIATHAPATDYSDDIYRKQSVYIGTNLNETANTVLQVGTGNNTNMGFLVSGDKGNDATNDATVPNLGSSSRLSFYPGKSAFRAGFVDGIQWDDVNTGKYSIAMGYDSKASGYSSFAVGLLSDASGFHGVAIGSQATASDDHSVAIGHRSKASGHPSVAIGEDTEATLDWASAFGTESRATSLLATAVGNSARASGPYSSAFGNSCWAQNQSASAMGSHSTAKGYGSTAVGYNNMATAYLSTSLGVWNDTIKNANPETWIETDPLIYFGNGTDGDARSNAAVVYKNANVDINGFTRLGKLSEAAPIIKMKKLTGSTPSTSEPNTFTYIATGIANPAKILSISAIVADGTIQHIPHSPQPGCLFTVHADGPLIAVGVQSVVLSTTVMKKPVKILITYEE